MDKGLPQSRGTSRHLTSPATSSAGIRSPHAHKARSCARPPISSGTACATATGLRRRLPLHHLLHSRPSTAPSSATASACASSRRGSVPTRPRSTRSSQSTAAPPGLRWATCAKATTRVPKRVVTTSTGPTTVLVDPTCSSSRRPRRRRRLPRRRPRRHLRPRRRLRHRHRRHHRSHRRLHPTTDADRQRRSTRCTLRPARSARRSSPFSTQRRCTPSHPASRTVCACTCPRTIPSD